MATVLLTTTCLSEAASRKAQIKNVILQNYELVSTLNDMGYNNVEEAALEFAMAEQKMETSLSDLNLGTLAICAKGSAQLIMGVEGKICSSLTNAYLVTAWTGGYSVNLSAALGSVYFYTSKPNRDKFCFMGPGLGGGASAYLSAEAMIEVSCKDGPESGVGALIGFSAGVGVGDEINLVKATEVRKIKSYFH